jgi:basic membrane protein A
MHIKLFSLSLLSTFLFSSEIKPAMLFDADIIFDNAWSETIYNGLKKFEKKTDIPIAIFNEVDGDKAIVLLQKLAKDGYNPILLSFTEYRKQAITQVMANYPKTRFIVLNGSLNMPNAHYISFSYQESSFLSGYLAAKKSKTQKIGFVGGAKIPVIKNFLCGYIKGAKYANKDIVIEHEYIGSDMHAFINPNRAYEIAKEQIKNGADVIFAPAGHSSVGALKAVNETKVYGIGVDSNQNGLYPGRILTSAMVRVDNAIMRALMAAKNNIWGPQMKIMGLQENGVELAFDEYNKNLVSEELRKDIERLIADIVLKKIELQHYAFKNECIYEGKKLF